MTRRIAALLLVLAATASPAIGAPDLAGAAGQRGHRAGGGDFAKGVVAAVGHVEISLAVQRQAVGIEKARAAA